VTALQAVALMNLALEAGLMKISKSAFGGRSGSAIEPEKNSIHNI